MKKQLFAFSVFAIHAVAYGQDQTAAGVAADPAPGSMPVARWHLQTSLATHHFHSDPNHNNHQSLVNLEYWRADNYIFGAAWFKNSFNQPSQYVYVGKQWRPFDTQQAVYFKLTGGLLHGYKDEFRDKIPLNHGGIAPVLVPSIGYSTRRFSTELVIFGTAGLMLNLGVFLN